jgi:hypothetical protein
VGVVESLGVHPVGDLRRQEALGRLDVGRAAGDLGELAVVLRGPQLEVHPRLGVGRGLPQQVGGGLREQHRYALGDGVGDECPYLGRRRERALPRDPAQQRHAQPAGGGPGHRQERREPALQSPGGVHGPPQVGPGPDDPPQRDDQGGGPRLRMVDVDAYGHGLLKGPGELPGGGERLVGGLRPDARYLPQLVPAGLEHRPYAAESGVLQRPEPQSPLGDVLQPGDRNPFELLGDQLGEDRRESGPYLLQRTPVIGEDPLREPDEPLPPGDHLPGPPPHTHGSSGRPLAPARVLHHGTPHTPPTPIDRHPSTPH